MRHVLSSVLVLILGFFYILSSFSFTSELAGRKGLPGGRVGGGTRHSFEEVVHVG